jgi:hypothetical protein
MIDKFLNKLFRLQFVKNLINHSILYTASSFTIGSIVSLLHLLKVTDLKLVNVYGNMFIGQSLFSIIVLGFVAYRNRFCDWSKTAYKAIIVYYLAFIIDEFIIELNLAGLVTLNIILLYYVLSSFVELIKTKQDEK